MPVPERLRTTGYVRVALVASSATSAHNVRDRSGDGVTEQVTDQALDLLRHLRVSRLAALRVGVAGSRAALGRAGRP